MSLLLMLMRNLLNHGDETRYDFSVFEGNKNITVPFTVMLFFPFITKLQ